MPAPHPGQEWTHGWIPITPTAAKSKNHGRKPGAGSLLARVTAEAGAIHKRMQEADANRSSKSDSKQTPKTPAKSSNATLAIAKKDNAGPAKTAAKPTPKPAGKPGAKVGVDSHGKPLRVGDEVQITGGKDHGKTGRVTAKGKSGQVRVQTGDGHEVGVHSINVRNKDDYESARQADAALRKAASRPSTPRADNGNSPHAAPSVKQVESNVRDAYGRLASRPGQWVGLKELRDEMGKSIPRDQVDQALRLMNRMPDVNFVPESNQKTLTQADRNAAVRLGDQDKHLIAIGYPR